MIVQINSSISWLEKGFQESLGFPIHCGRGYAVYLLYHFFFESKQKGFISQHLL